MVNNFLGNHRSPAYVSIFENCVNSFENLGERMSQVHFLRSHLNFFSSNTGEVSDEDVERFLHEIKKMKKRYQGRTSKNMIAD